MWLLLPLFWSHLVKPMMPDLFLPLLLVLPLLMVLPLLPLLLVLPFLLVSPSSFLLLQML